MQATATSERTTTWQEALALVLAISAIVMILRALLEGVVHAQTIAGEGASSWNTGYFLVSLTTGADPLTALLAAGALVLAAQGGSHGRGRIGTTALRLVPIIALVVVALAVLGIEEIFRQGYSLANGAIDSSPVRDFGTLDEAAAKVAMVLGYVPAILIAGTSGVIAWRLAGSDEDGTTTGQPLASGGVPADRRGTDSTIAVRPE